MQQQAAITFKNVVKSRWAESDRLEGTTADVVLLNAADRAAIKNGLVDLMCS